MTIFIEFLVYLILINRSAPELLLCSILINAFTNPLLNYAYNYLGGALMILEGIVVGIEAVMIMGLMNVGPKKALLISLIANLTTAFAGLLCF